MPDPTLSEVEQEAYASASPDKLMIDTISIYYDGLVNDNDEPDELFLFNGNNAHSVSDEGVPLLFARIEAGAPRRAGELVTMLGIPFQLTRAPMTTETVAAAQLSIDSVEREAHDLLEAAAKGGKQIEVTYRSYRSGAEDGGPESLPPRRFIMTGASGSNASIDGRLVFLAIGKKPFPADTYRPDEFRTLSYA